MTSIKEFYSKEFNEIKEMRDRYFEMQKCYQNNLMLCRWQEKLIDRLATAIEKIDKILKVYFDDDNKTTREIEKIIEELTKEQTDENEKGNKVHTKRN